MASYLWYRKLYFFKEQIASHFQAHKTLYIIGILCFLFGFITGIFSAIKYAEMVSFKDISDTVLLNYLTNNASIVGLFFSRFIGYFFLLILLFFLGSVVWLAPFGFLFLIYKSFMSALTISFFIILCGVSGILLTILVLLPVTILFGFAFITLVVTCTNRSFLCKKYSLIYVSNDAPNFLYYTICVVTSLLLLACIWELILLPIVSSTIIIII